MRRIIAALLLIALVALPGCGPAEPVVVSREALGTVVSVTAYGEDEVAVRAAVDDAFAVMDEIAAPLDAYAPASDISAFNRQPYTAQPIPPHASDILDAIEDLEVGDAFSPALLAVTRLYDFEGAQTVPADADLDLALSAAGGFVRPGAETAIFSRLKDPDLRLEPGGALTPGLDLGGAAKGLALDAARESLRASSAVTAALITSGSSSVTLGTKPDGSVWRIGVEDPRELERVIAVFSFEGEGALSTSGDYQRYFETGGVRYHHILDPETGLPARGVRSLTVAGTSLSGLHSDILSTALFVRGPESAIRYAAERGVAVVVVDDEGRTLVVPAPEGSGLSVAEEASPDS
ncbi:MAG: FAD:protein FMN transferase [Coriobacteriia bacterium]